MSPRKKRRGVSARQLNFDVKSTSCEEMHDKGGNRGVHNDIPFNGLINTSDGNEEVVKNQEDQGNIPKKVTEDVEGGNRGVHTDILFNGHLNVNDGNEEAVIDQEVQENIPEKMTEDLTTGNHRIEELTEKNARLHERIKELEVKLAESRGLHFEAEKYILQEKVKRLEQELLGSKYVFAFRNISHDKNLVSHYTGLPNKETFFALPALFDNIEIIYAKGWKVRRLSKEDQLFLTLMKLRRNPTTTDLDVRFKINQATVINIFLSWLMALHNVIFVQLMATVPSKEKNQSDMPECFREYRNTRFIFDCTEATTATPPLLCNQNRMYSAYKGRITSKGLVVISLNGTIVRMSKLYAGSTSDRNIVIDSGILNCLLPGDSIMADKRFNITDLMPDGVGLNVPPFKHNPQFTPAEVEETVSIAAARIHVERAINRIKKFTILDCIPEFVV